MKLTTKVRFTEPQIALVMRGHPNCNLDRLTAVSFEFDQAGKIVGCFGTIKDFSIEIVVVLWNVRQCFSQSLATSYSKSLLAQSNF
jgi:hypothetical protein